MHGSVDARGGDVRGDGGFIEISGKKGFEYLGMCNRLASNGDVGTLLLDPESDVTVSTAGTSNGAFNASNVFTPTAAGSNVQIGPGAGSLITELTLGNVTVQTTGVFGGAGGNGDITIEDSFTTASANSLTFTAAGNITVDPTLTLTHNGPLVFNSGGNMLLQSTISGPTSISITTWGNLDLISTAAPGANLPDPATVAALNIFVGGNLNMNSTSASPVFFGNNNLVSFDLQVLGDFNMTGNMGLGGVHLQTNFNVPCPTNIRISGDLNIFDSNSTIGALFRPNLSSPADVFEVLGDCNVVTQDPAGFARFSTTVFVDSIYSIGKTFTIDGIGAECLLGGSGAGVANVAVENFIVQNNGRLRSLGGVSPIINLIAADSITFSNNAIVDRLGGAYTLNLVVDNANPTLPGIGAGAFNIDATSTISSPINSSLRIFTASQSQNTIDLLAIINGANFSAGPYNVDTAQEIWSTYYPSSLGAGFPFTFFYKEPAAIINNPVVQESKSIAQLETLRDFVFFDEIVFLESAYEARIISKTNPEVQKTIPFWMRYRNYGTNLTKQVGDVLPQ